MTLRSYCVLLCSLLLLAACGSSTEDSDAPAAAASGASAAAATPPPASAPVDTPPAADVPAAPAASADVFPPEVAAQAAPAESEPPAEPTVYGADGMHPVCEAYFQRARRCFARAPADRAALLQQSLAATRAELLSADADTCREISRQFDDMAQAMACEADGGTEAQKGGSFR